MSTVVIHRIIWEQCSDVDVFGKRFRICARVTLEGATLYLEIEADGQRAKMPLAAVDVVLFTIFGFIEIRLKVSDIKFDGNNLKRLCLELRACAFGQCARIYEHCENFIVISSGEKKAHGIATDILPAGSEPLSKP